MLANDDSTVIASPSAAVDITTTELTPLSAPAKGRTVRGELRPRSPALATLKLQSKGDVSELGRPRSPFWARRGTSQILRTVRSGQPCSAGAPFPLARRPGLADIRR